jgi:TonB family protein
MGFSALRSKLHAKSRRREIARVGLAWIIATGLALVAAAAMADDGDAGDDGSKKAARGTMAKPLDRTPPGHPSGADVKEREGWVVVSYCIEKDGTVGDIVIEDSSGVDAFERAALAAVEKWRFEPATFDGEPIEQCRADVTIPFQLEMSDHARGPRRSFATKYRRAERARDRGDISKAEGIAAQLAELDDLNMYETSQLAILNAGIANDTGDDGAELRSLERALRGDAGFLDAEMRTATLQRIFVLEVTTRDYAAALDTYQELVEAADGKRVPGPIEEKVEQIRGFAGGTDVYLVPGRIGAPHPAGGDQGSWSHKLLRRTVGFGSGSLEGIDGFDLRCDFHRAKGIPKADRALKIPEDWGECWIYVFGRPGAEFQVVEYGANL